MKTAVSQTSRRLSTGYAAELRPSRRLRLVVSGSGWILLLLGSVLLLHADTSVALRCLMLAVWLGDAGSELYRFGRAQVAVTAVVLERDNCFARDRRGVRQTLSLRGGSLVMGRLAWLRFRRADGGSYTELFQRERIGADAWRRLRVLWRWGDLQGRLVDDK